MAAIVAEIVKTGPFFSGNTGPEVELILEWDSGGFVDLAGASVTVNVHRWDPRRKTPVGPLILSGDGSSDDPGRGQCLFDWNAASPISSVPLDSGWYMIQADVTFPDGNEQLSQRAIFEVLPL